MVQEKGNVKYILAVFHMGVMMPVSSCENEIEIPEMISDYSSHERKQIWLADIGTGVVIKEQDIDSYEQTK